MEVFAKIWNFDYFHLVDYISGSRNAIELKFYTAIGHSIPNMHTKFHHDCSTGSATASTNTANKCICVTQIFRYNRLDRLLKNMSDQRYLHHNIPYHVLKLWCKFGQIRRYLWYLTNRYQLAHFLIFGIFPTLHCQLTT